MERPTHPGSRLEPVRISRLTDVLRAVDKPWAQQLLDDPDIDLDIEICENVAYVPRRTYEEHEALMNTYMAGLEAYEEWCRTTGKVALERKLRDVKERLGEAATIGNLNQTEDLLLEARSLGRQIRELTFPAVE